jgi:hypothetical protein
MAGSFLGGASSMRIPRTVATVALAALVPLACGPAALAAAHDAMPEADPVRIRADLAFLADDLLEGREAGSRGHEIAARYVAARFEALGLEADGTEGWFQPVPLRAARLELASPELTLLRDSETRTLRFPTEFVVGASTVREQSVLEAELVFAGYGLVAEPFEHDDYAGLDVEGRIVVVLAGAPLSWPSEERAHFSREKARLAAARGARGILTIPTPVSERVFPFARRSLYLHAPRMDWLEADGSVHDAQPELQVGAVLAPEAVDTLFEGAPRSAAELMEAVEADRIPAGFPLPGRIRLAYASTLEDLSSPNVIARLPGSDPARAHEHVVLTAHLDHIGLARTMDEDRINNGAMDNASGVATLLEAARLLRAARPARSVLFTIVTAEEKGLLGASYFAHHPTVPAEDLIANVNLDMPMLLFPFADVVAFGAEHSTVADTVAEAAASLGVALAPDPFPEQAIFVRSDHYRFVQQGIPAVMLATGFGSRDPERPGEAAWQRFLAEDYHMPSDELDQGIDFDAAARFAALNARVALGLADAPERPRWREGDFFGELYGVRSEAAP